MTTAIVIGSGPGGSAAASVLAEAGWSVVILERGRNHLLDGAGNPARVFSNDELKFTARHFLGPDPLIEPRTFRPSPDDGDHTHIGEVNNLPATVGGGGVHADGKLPRFLEEDFHLRSARGPIDGAEVADWPLEYADLEPFYAEAERLIGVAGDATANPLAAWRSGPYPMPPGPPMYAALLTSAAAERLGYHPYPAPTGCNSVPYDGRPACNNCGFCAFYGCPIHAKGDPVGLLRRALATGRTELRPECFATRIHASNGRATGVSWIDQDGRLESMSADHVVVAGGALETPRLLLLSRFEHPLIGRHLMFHFQTFVMGYFPQRLHPHRGRAVTHVHDDHLIPDEESMAAARAAGLPWFRGGMVEHAGPAHPVLEAKLYPWGPAHKDCMRASALREHLWGFCMQGEDLPVPDNRVDLDPTIRDVRGIPVARVTQRPHRHEEVASSYYAPKLEAILRSAGAGWTSVTTSPGPVLSPISQSRHVAGTVRMGRDPATSACDEWGRLHEAPNVLIADSSVFVTSAGYGPTLTLVALALRNARALAGAA